MNTSSNITKNICVRRFFTLKLHSVYLREATNLTQQTLFGDGQGIGWSSVNQIIISSVIDYAFNKLADKFQVTSADGVFKILTGTNFFIDDRISNTINHDGDMGKLLKDFQQNETLQTELLNTTGGAVAPKKCCWWLLQREPNSDCFQFRVRPSKTGKLSLRNTGDTTPYDIKRLNPREARKYLGCLISPSFSPKQQLKKLHEIVDKWRAKVKHATLTQVQIRKAYNERLVPKLSYPLVVCDITKPQAEALMRKIRTTFAEKTKYHRSTALDITHGPCDLFGEDLVHIYDLFGEDLVHIYDLAGREKFAFFQMHVRSALNKKDTVHDALMTSFLDHQLALGSITNFLNLDYDVWHECLKSRTWLVSLWEYLQSNSTLVDIVHIPSYSLPRENDFYLMKEILLREKDPKKIRIFNKVRMHLELLSASDIVLEDGLTFHDEIMQNKTFTSRTSTYNWPRKEKFNVQWFVTFRQMLQEHIYPALKSANLGEWIGNSHQQHKAQLLSPTSIYYDNSIFNLYKGDRFHRSNTTSSPQANAPSVAILPTNENSIQLLDISSFDINNIPPLVTPSPNDWKKQFWGLEPLAEEKLLELYEHMKKPFIAVSDGGLPNGCDYSVFSWGLADTKGTVFFKTGLPIGGLQRDRSSYGIEAYGFFSMLSFINMMDSRFPNISRDRKYFCDNLEVTKTTPSFYTNPKRSAATKRHYDIFTQLRHELACHAFPITIQHVKGHQDDIKEWHQLTPAEKVNCIVDGHGHYIEDVVDKHPEYIPPPVTFFLPAQGISLHSPLHRLVTNSFHEICLDEKTANLIHHLNRKKGLSAEDSHLIDWSAFQGFSKSVSHTTRRKFQKIIYNKWLTMSKLLMMEKSPNATCPLCTEVDESQQHVPHCQHDSAIAARQVALTTFKQSLLAYKTPHALTEVLSHILLYGTCDDDIIKAHILAYPTMQHKLYAAIDDQICIGLHNMQAGLLAQSWAHLIHAHYKTANIKNRNSTSWMRHVVGDTLAYTHATWVHRCETTNEPGDIALKTYRLKLLNEFKILQIDPTPIGNFKSLLRRSDEFFKRHAEDQLKAWEAKILDATRKTAQGKKKRKGVRQHFTTIRIRPARRVRLFPAARKNRRRSRKEKKARRAKIIRQSNILKYCGLVQQQPPEPYATTPKLVPPSPNIC